ncbi:DUF1203 domain-containing protein [Paraherbaspirillum soli]|uniref:DUF1203 domain-containing protein n=1 Tax=Paraherbaspirillum soli TaxID=631222 RepID=A0ABW0MBA5_9BURK
MSFRILGLTPEQFRPLFAMTDLALKQLGAVRLIADGQRIPCRVSMEHAIPGEEILLLNFEHQPANTPYRAAHAIYVRKGADKTFKVVDTVPELLASRLLSVRAFDGGHMMIEAEVCEGIDAAKMFEQLLANPQTSYLHVHIARRGCYLARVERG